MFKVLIAILAFSNISLASDALVNYETTDLQSESLLQEAFNITRKHGSGECFQRAHFWSYQLQKVKGYNTQKTFIFFSSRYKRLIQGQWWFHVAPSIYMQGNQYVFDNEFLPRAVTLEAWKNGAIDHGIRYLTQMKKNFDREKKSLNSELENPRIRSRRKNYIQSRIKYIYDLEKKYLISGAKIIKANKDNWPWNNREDLIDIDCPKITHYSEYKKNSELFHCFIMDTSMYYFEPEDLDKLEKSGINRSSWNDNEVFNAFKYSFGGRFPFSFQ